MKIRFYFLGICLFLLFFGYNSSISALTLSAASGDAPSIYYQSGPKAVDRSSAVNFYAYGEQEDISYQWWCDDYPLVDTDEIKGTATNHLSISSVSCADNGRSFWCVLSNPYGTTSSEVFPLTVKHIYDQKEQTAATLIQKESCEQEGKYYYTCLCGAKGDTFTVAPLPHSGGHATCNQQAICSSCHQPYGEFSGEHDFKDWEGDASQHWHRCSRCDFRQDIAAHSPGAAATENTPQCCTVCGYVLTSALGHHHDPIFISAVASTCTLPGNIAYYQCACGKYFADEAAQREITDHSAVLLPLEEHRGGKATCTAPAICAVCHNEYGRAKDHSFTVMQHDENSHWLCCSACGAAQTLFPHQWNASDTGEDTQICIVCSYERPISHRHSLSEIPKKEATCTESGQLSYYHCSCGMNFYDPDGTKEISDLSDLEIPALSHCGGTATCKEPAQCSRCGQFYGAYGNHDDAVIQHDATQHWYQCGLCGELYGTAAHYGGAASCTSKAQCALCREEYGDPLSHDYSLWQYDTESHHRRCKGCGTAEASSPHSFDIAAASASHPIVLQCRCGFQKVTAALPFQDVRSEDWFYEDIVYAYGNGLLRGMKENLFGINVDTTRAMVVTILYRLEGEGKINDAPFKDVSLSHWFGPAVSWAAKNKIVEGYGNGFFGPDDPVTREQLASILYRYAKYKGYDTSSFASIDAFPDNAAVSFWAKDSLSWAVSQGLIRGIEEKGTSYLRPQSNAVRTQIAAILHRFCSRYRR